MDETSVIKNIQTISARCKALRMGTESLNIIEMLRLDKNVLETAHSRALKEFLSAGEGYDYPFLKLFLSTVKLEVLKSFNPSYFHCEKFNIDILITGKVDKEDYAIIIENKINEAGDQEEQIERYISTVKSFYNCKEENIYILYLVSGQGKIIPAEHSISSERREYFEERGQFITISYIEDIVKFLDKILTTWSNESIRTAAYQYQEYIKDIYGINDKERGYIEMENDILYKELKLADGKPSQKLFDFLNDIEKTKSSVYQLLGKELLHDIHSLYKDSSTLFDDEVVVNIPFTFGEQKEDLRLHVKNNEYARTISFYLEEKDDVLINVHKEKISVEMNKCLKYFFNMIAFPYKESQKIRNLPEFYKYWETIYHTSEDYFKNYYRHSQLTSEWLKLYKELEIDGSVLDITTSEYDFFVNQAIIYEDEKVMIKLIFGNYYGRAWIGFAGCDENKVPLQSDLVDKIKNCFHIKLDTYKSDVSNCDDYSYFCNFQNSATEFKEIYKKIKQTFN